MRLICVGGMSSGCGKTSLVCLLLRALPGWAAMKVVPSRMGHVCPHGRDCDACEPPEGAFEVAIDEEIRERAGKDTARFAEAGASHVALVRALPECLPAALDSAMERFSGVPGVVIESTTAMPAVEGPRIIVARNGLAETKHSARIALGSADLIVMNQEVDAAGEGGFDLPEGFGGTIVTACAALPADHPRNRQLMDLLKSALTQG